MSERDQIGDVDEPEISKESVVKRVKDWLKRLDALLNQIKNWASANGWTVEDGAPVPMREEPMERFAVPESRQPSLSIRSVQGAEIWIKPKGLWVIGANGRVDIYIRARERSLWWMSRMSFRNRVGSFTVSATGRRMGNCSIPNSSRTSSDDATGSSNQSRIRLDDRGLSSGSVRGDGDRQHQCCRPSRRDSRRPGERGVCDVVCSV
jgi:hypothetical protein